MKHPITHRADEEILREPSVYFDPAEGSPGQQVEQVPGYLFDQMTQEEGRLAPQRSAREH